MVRYNSRQERQTKIPNVGVWRRLVARYLGVVEAVGSSPVTPTRRANLSNDLIRQLRGYSYIRLWALVKFWSNRDKSSLTAIFFVDVEHIDYFVRCPCLDFVEGVSVYPQSRCRRRVPKYLRNGLSICSL